MPIKKSYKIVFVIIAAIIIFVGLARFLTGEDTWICDHGQWVKHGAPSSPMPTKLCK